jgi:hypothetical protein
LKRRIALLLCLGAAPVHAETLTLQGLGPAHIGMTHAQLERALARKIPLSGAASGDAAVCATAKFPGREAALMFEKYRLTRIDVWRTDAIATAEGAHVGSSEAQLRRLYGRRAVFTDHPYLEKEGHYVTVRYRRANRELLFETDHGTVTGWRIGYPKSVAYIEGCA